MEPENQPTIEDLQRQMIEMQETMAKLSQQNAELEASNKKLSEDYKKSADLNKDLMLRIPFNDYGKPKEEPPQKETLETIIEEKLKTVLEKRFGGKKQ